MTGCMDVLQFLRPYLRPDYHRTVTFPEQEAEIYPSSHLLHGKVQNFAKFEESSWVGLVSLEFFVCLEPDVFILSR